MNAYELILDFDYRGEVNTQGYEVTRDEKDRKKYRDITIKLIDKLFNHLSNQDGLWDTKIIAVSTFKQDEGVNSLVECANSSNCYQSEKRGLLRIHMLVCGRNSSEVISCISDYWTNQYGMKINVTEYQNPPNVYYWGRFFESRELAKRTLVLQSLRFSF